MSGQVRVYGCLVAAFTVVAACAADEDRPTAADSEYRLVADYGDAIGLVRESSSGMQILLTDPELTTDLLSATVSFSAGTLVVDYGPEGEGILTLPGSQSSQGSQEDVLTPSYFADLLYSIHRNMAGDTDGESSPYDHNTRYNCLNASQSCIGGNPANGCTSDCSPIGYCNGSVYIYPGGIYNSSCYEHDTCFIRNDCSSTSWLPWFGSRACDMCNADVLVSITMSWICDPSGLICTPYFEQTPYANLCTGADGTCVEDDQRRVTGGVLWTH